MMKTKRFLTIVALCLLCLQSSAQYRIIGGHSCNIKERPYQVKITGFSFPDNKGKVRVVSGGGVILDNQWILTAAHVVNDKSINDIYVNAGYTYPPSAYAGISAEEVIVHPGYNAATHDNDIALLRLNRPLVYSDSIAPIAIEDGISLDGTTAIVSSWGKTSVNDSDMNSYLKMAEVKIDSITPNLIYCSPSANTPYIGDSGGPLTVTTDGVDYLLGIVSRGNSKEPTKVQTVYTNVRYFSTWLSQYLPLYKIQGPDHICDSEIFRIVAPGASVELSPNLSFSSHTGNLYSLSRQGNGSGFIILRANGRNIAKKYISVGEPVVSGVSQMGNTFYVQTYGDGIVYKTEWQINGNVFSTYDNFYTYSSWDNNERQVNLSVRAFNSCGASSWYSTMVTVGGDRYMVSKNPGSHTIMVKRINGDTQVYSAMQSGQVHALKYQLLNAKTGAVCKVGTLEACGGSLDVGGYVSNAYILRLIDGNHIETHKISF